MPESHWSKEHNAWIKECSRCCKLFIGVDDIDASHKIFSLHFGIDNNQREGLNVRCKVCTRLGKHHIGVKWKGHNNLVLGSHVRELLKEQGGKCAICDVEISFDATIVGSIATARIDHDHVTNDIRGLLCNTCNTHIPILEVPEWRRRADAYLDNYKNRYQSSQSLAKPIEPRTCVGCGVEFIPQIHTKIFCTRACKINHQNKNWRDHEWYR